MRTLILNKFLHRNGGSETYIFKLGEALEQHGHEVQYFGMEHEGRCVGNRVNAYTSDMDFHGGSKLSKLTYPIKTIYSKEARVQLRKVLDDFKPDVCHLNNFNYQLTPSIILEIVKWRKETGRECKIIFTAHDYQLVCPNHLSAKIAAADHVMQKKGMYLGGYRPFGFLPDPNDCHKLILDPVASQYVRLIFELALQGNRTGTIAKILNEKQIPTPAAYHVAENHVYSEQKAWDLQRSHWTSGTVYHILKNEKYKGTYVGAKFIMPVPCKHRILRAPLEQQVRIEDSHAAIVTPEEFAQAQKVIMLQHGNHQAGNYTKRQYPLKGKVYCGYCRKLMKYRVLKKLGPSFNCRFSATAVDSPCKRIPISEKVLEEIVRNALTVQIKQAEHMLEILHERERKALICFSALERQEEKLSAEKAEIVKQRVALYEQYADGNMSKEEFIRQRDSYRAQEDERMEQIQRLRTEKDQAFQPVKKDTDNLQAVMDTVGGAGDVMHLSQNVVETFIDRIEVFNDESVKIRFTFEDVLKNYEAE